MRVIFLYWGRRGLAQFAFELAEAARRMPGLRWQLSLSRQGEEFERFATFGDAILPVDTFTHGHGAISAAHRIFRLQRAMAEAIRRDRVEVVVNLMPHVWSPFVVDKIRAAGARYATLMHDAQRHPGDRTGLVHRLLIQDLTRADRVITLSNAVADQLQRDRAISPSKLVRLFHPWLSFGVRSEAPRPPAHGSWRLLFLGRIMAYKGLPVLLDALEQLRGSGRNFTLSVLGAGDITALRPRLERLGATIVNRWLSNEEIAAALGSHHAVVLSHIEASQSGIAAAALGAGVPVVGLPTGGLLEQIEDGHTGLLATRADGRALAEAIDRLVTTPQLYETLTDTIARRQPKQSMEAFLASMLQAI